MVLIFVNFETEEKRGGEKERKKSRLTRKRTGVLPDIYPENGRMLVVRDNRGKVGACERRPQAIN